MTNCPNCGSTHCVNSYISCKTNEDHTAIIGQYRKYTCTNCNCYFAEQYENGKETITVFTELDTDRKYEVVLGTTVSSRMNEEEAIYSVKKMSRLFPNKNVYYRLAQV